MNSASNEKLPGQLEVKDTQLIFNSIWERLEDGFGVENLRFPKELILLGGAPGAGKGTNTDFIRKVRDITAEPIVVSSLLCTPEAEKTKSRGGMVGDREVVYLGVQGIAAAPTSRRRDSGWVSSNNSAG